KPFANARRKNSMARSAYCAFSLARSEGESLESLAAASEGITEDATNIVKVAPFQASLSDNGLGFIDSLQVLSALRQRTGPKDTSRRQVPSGSQMSLVGCTFEPIDRPVISGQGNI